MKSIIRHISCFIIGVIHVFTWMESMAQVELPYELISMEQGLSQGTIFDILQDREGFIWFGTKDGLNRYDGYNFEVFTNDPNDPWSISGNTVVQLFEDSKGRIWAASDNEGINIYDKISGRFHHIQHDPTDPTGLSGNFISGIVEDTSGYFVIGIEGVGINMFKLEEDFFHTNKSPHIIHVSLPPHKRIEEAHQKDLRGIIKDAKDRIWVGGDNAIYRLDVLQAKMTLGIEGYSFERAFVNSDGSIWADGDAHNNFYWDGDNASNLLNSFNGILGVCTDKNKNIWIASSDTLYGLKTPVLKSDLYDNLNSENFFFKWQPEGVSTNFPFRSMILDNSGILWLGTNGYGIYKISPNCLDFSHHFERTSIRQIVEVSENNFFIKQYVSGWYDGDGYSLGMDPLQIFGEEQICDVILTSTSNRVWSRHYFGAGVFKLRNFNPTTGEYKVYDIGWRHHNGQPMIESRDGTIWMAGIDDILAKFNPKDESFISFDISSGKRLGNLNSEERLFNEEFSTALYEDIEGIFWVGTERGFTKCIRPKSEGMDFEVTNYMNIPNDPNSLSYNHVTCFMDDPNFPNRYLWISTKGGGINRFDKKSGVLKRITKSDGIPDNVVYGILPDKSGNIWGSTNKGLFCLSYNSNGDQDEMSNSSNEFTIRNFSRNDGLQHNEFNSNAFTKLLDGKLAFGGINGYNVFDPNEILSNEYHPSTFITSISINNQKIKPRDETGILSNTINTTKQITLSYLENMLTLEFTSLDFSGADQNKYRYQLIGADDSWVEAGNVRSATFLHLQPKKYTFRVQGSNSQGVWNDHIAELKIVVLPPWWLSWWAYAAYLLLSVALAWTILKFYINRTKLTQQLEFEKREADRIRDLDVLKTQLYMNMTHEFRTPLTIILGMAKQVIEDPKEHFQNGMNLIIRNGNNLLGLVNKMLNLSKLESGKMKLHLVQGDIVLFLRNNVESFSSYAANKEIQLHFLPEVDSVIMDFDEDKLQQVISNLISNAFKFTPEGGNIYFGIRKINGSFEIRVKDTGQGISQKDQNKIFDRFYQVDNTVTRQYDGSGIGLALSKNLVMLMSGTISVQSPPIGSKKGTEFRIELPIKQAIEVGKKVFYAPKIQNTIETKKDTSSAQVAKIGPLSNSIELSKNTPSHNSKNEEQPLILLVEDNADVVAYVASCLTDYQLAVAENGQEGFEIAIEMIPDLIISDVMMPIMDGFELCRKLKSDERTDHIPVIILTARADMDSKLEGLELGANAYLPKPYEKQELLLSIKNLFKLRDKLRNYYQNVAGLTEDDSLVLDNSPTIKTESTFVLKVRDIIEEHIDDFNFNVEQLANSMFLSHSQFRRKLEALTGYSPNRFIRFIRLKKAKELLKDEELSITTIAYDCGFNDPSYFSRVFKKEFKQTPVEWRNQTV